MDLLNQLLSEEQIYYWDTFIQDWGMTIAIGVLLVELLFLSIKKKLTPHLLADSVTNFVTFGLFFIVGYLLIGALYVATFYWVYANFSITQLPINGWVIAVCIVLADMVYYWEHRFMHRVGLGWATHMVHHSSPYFNISVAYRFGPLDGIMPLLFHLPLVILGFNPLVIILAEGVVQLYQTLLHTEVVKKLPKPIEAVMNTPSHHRVHHGSNPQYIDKNYAGIFIIWDKLFGTFAAEEEPVNYGVTTPINTVNPLKVFFLGLIKISTQMSNTKGFINKIKCLVKPPGWVPDAL